MAKVENEIPWDDSTKWTRGHWYPMPIGYFARDQDEYIINGYDIFELEPLRDNGDIKPVVLEKSFPCMTFEMALMICETKNGKKML